jgi:hypothetical protein
MRGWCVLVLTLLGGGSAAAETLTTYRVEGFTADGKRAVFRRERTGGEDGCRELALEVHETATGRQLETRAILRDGKGCSTPLVQADGLRERARLMTKHGSFVPQTRLEPRGDALVAEGTRLTLAVEGTLPPLDARDPAMAGKRAELRLLLVVERKGAKRTLLDRKVKVAPVLRPGSEIFAWRKPSLSEAQLSADGRVLAVILDERPELLRLPTLTPSAR